MNDRMICAMCLVFVWLCCTVFEIPVTKESLLAVALGLAISGLDEPNKNPRPKRANDRV